MTLDVELDGTWMTLWEGADSYEGEDYGDY
jgi:hypothetical protein